MEKDEQREGTRNRTAGVTMPRIKFGKGDFVVTLQPVAYRAVPDFEHAERQRRQHEHHRRNADDALPDSGILPAGALEQRPPAFRAGDQPEEFGDAAAKHGFQIAAAHVAGQPVPADDDHRRHDGDHTDVTPFAAHTVEYERGEPPEEQQADQYVSREVVRHGDHDDHGQNEQEQLRPATITAALAEHDRVEDGGGYGQRQRFIRELRVEEQEI